MNNIEAIIQMRDDLSKFISHVAIQLPFDVENKLIKLKNLETEPLAKEIYQAMSTNQELASKLQRPSCQDTGILQFHVKCGTNFPLLGDLKTIFKNAVYNATKNTPLRHDCVETFIEENTDNNIGSDVPTIFWDIIPNNDTVDITVYMAGGGCTLPGRAMVLMPSEGYEGVVSFVLDVITSYGVNACPPLLVGIGIATSVETAALLSKKALMRSIGTPNHDPRAEKLEKLLEDGINKIGLGPQGVSGFNSVMGVHIENSARHPSTIGVAVNIGCWSHRRGNIIFDAQLNYSSSTHYPRELYQ